jgi:hypothetical protein
MKLEPGDLVALTTVWSFTPYAVQGDYIDAREGDLFTVISIVPDENIPGDDPFQAVLLCHRSAVLVREYLTNQQRIFVHVA